ncbi:MAG: hypothetical protein KDJ37_16345 [Hyphomicrobiaceae bacterium]|nr:hypothetical protein [Hyphomicrobiaceae bacterium]
MKIWTLVSGINWRLVVAALFGIGALHILATLAAPDITRTTAFDRLKRELPPNKLLILPPMAPGQQPLPFMTPAQRFAMCRFDTRVGPVEIAANLEHPGSSLTIYSTGGDVVFAAAATNEAVAQRVRLIPPDGRFLGLSPEARGVIARNVPSATVAAKSGIIVVALPERGIAYQAETGRALEGATCGPVTDAIASSR